MSSKAFIAKQFAWLRLLKTDRDFTALAVGVQMLDHFNESEGGRARAGCKFIGDKIGVEESTVVRAVHRMHERGRLHVEWGKQGRGHPNQYWMIVEPGKPAPAQVSEPPKPAPAHVLIPAPPQVLEVPAPPENLRQRNIKPAPAQVNLSKNRKKEEEDISHDLFDGGRELVVSHETSAPPPIEKKPFGLDTMFAEFMAAYPKQVDPERPFKEFRRALHKGARFADIMAGVARYVTAKPWSEPKYIKHPANWLRERMWLDEYASSSATGSRSAEEIAINMVLEAEREEYQAVAYVH